MGVLMRRVLHGTGVFELEIARPFRVKRQRVVREGELERSIVQAERSRAGASSVFIVLDADDDCPADLGSLPWRSAGPRLALRTHHVRPPLVE